MSDAKQAVFANDTGGLRSALNRGGSPSETTGTGLSLLCVAVRKGLPAIAKVLLEAGAPVEFDGPGTDRTPLIDAASFARSEIAMLLLARGANVHAREESGATPLHRAVSALDPSEVPPDFWYGSMAEREQIVRALLDRGADANARDQDGFTPLHLAAGSGSVTIVRMLLATGANANAVAKDGSTPWDIAKLPTNPSRGRPRRPDDAEVLQLIEQHGGGSGKALRRRAGGPTLAGASRRWGCAAVALLIAPMVGISILFASH